MSSSVFGEGMTTYASGVSTETPTDALQFLENFTNGRDGTNGIAIDLSLIHISEPTRPY